jgi:hypothetical protein
MRTLHLLKKAQDIRLHQLPEPRIQLHMPLHPHLFVHSAYIRFEQAAQDALAI